MTLHKCTAALLRAKCLPQPFGSCHIPAGLLCKTCVQLHTRWCSKIAYSNNFATRLFCKAALAHRVCLLSPAVHCLCKCRLAYRAHYCFCRTRVTSALWQCEYMHNQECRKTYAGLPCLAQNAWPEAQSCSARSEACIQSDEGLLSPAEAVLL